MKSTVEQIRERFDNDVERFSNLETGQTAAINSLAMLQLIACAAASVSPCAGSVLDVGCGAGNYTLRLLLELPGLDCTLVDLSSPMLERAMQRVSAATPGIVTTMQGDIREVNIGTESYDVVLTAMTLHHMRSDDEWRLVYQKLHDSLRPGGSIWVADMVEQSTPGVQQLMWQRYGEYLIGVKDEAYRDHVFAYIVQEDTPRPLVWQLNLLAEVGFKDVDVLHKNSCFAAFGGVKR